MSTLARFFGFHVCHSMNYFFPFERRSNTHRTEGLTALSVRCVQPSQQHGRRMPSLSSLTSRRTWSCLVSTFLTKITQQIHSLRASGVRSSQAARAARSDASARRISGGNGWTVPVAIDVFVIRKVSLSFCMGGHVIHFAYCFWITC